MDSDADRKAAVEIDPDREYRALLRSLRWTEGFGLLFVQCSPAEGVRLVERVQSDLPQKRIDLLTLTEPIEKLYETVAAFPQIDQLDVLFIQGIEYSLYDYEKNQIWDETDNRYGYSEKNVSRLLTHLNLSRERFHHHLNVHLVFLVPLFALKYLSRRAPDFFDWRSGVLEFPSDLDTLDQQTTRIF
ncbi:MAG: hypothetical protein MUF72_15320, partial [Elainella sp. Prado103]|nr:hypothetical protein [Elainella sp. Prado103]